jgi:hypothetical protein
MAQQMEYAERVEFQIRVIGLVQEMRARDGKPPFDAAELNKKADMYEAQSNARRYQTFPDEFPGRRELYLAKAEACRTVAATLA